MIKRYFGKELPINYPEDQQLSPPLPSSRRRCQTYLKNSLRSSLCPLLPVCAILSAIFGDFADFGIILSLVFINGILGYMEEKKSMAALSSLTQSISSTVTCVRNGESKDTDVEDLVPGDIVMLVGGNKVPADIQHLKGDSLKVDTAALTGEPIPRVYPGPHGGVVMCGCTVCEGEAYGRVLRTGEETETGRASRDVADDKRQHVVSLFETKIMKVRGGIGGSDDEEETLLVL